MADETIDINEKVYVKSDVIARLFGLTVRRVQQLVQDGYIHTEKTPTGAVRYDFYKTINEYVTYLSNKAHGKAKSDTEAELKNQKLKAEIALKESQGELHKLRTDIAMGKYISVEEAKLDYSRFFVVLKKFVMGIPAKISGRIAGCADPVTVRQIEKDLQKETTKLLKNFVLSASVEQPANKDADV